MNNIFSIFPYGRKKNLLKLSRATKATLYYYNYSLDLLSNQKYDFGINHYLKRIDDTKLVSGKNDLEVHHLFYELSEIILFQQESSFKSAPLALEIIYSEVDILTEEDFQGSFSGKAFQSTPVCSPEFSNYDFGFQKGMSELLNGNSYQFNYTQRFAYKVGFHHYEDVLKSFFSKKESLGQFAHATYIGPWDKLILSNSPESLFQWRGNGFYSECVTSPIKGTVRRDYNRPLRDQWNELMEDEKNQAELYMIIDLLRNDLNSIDLPICKVVRKKARLLVPGLIHQMGVIKVKLPPVVSLGKLVRSLFPGGSITGAPKKRTVQILRDIEDGPRGIYTGSTMLLMNGRVDCSINIRTAEIDLKEKSLSYGAGGGITLQSHSDSEFQEMQIKVRSFLDTFFKS